MQPQGQGADAFADPFSDPRSFGGVPLNPRELAGRLVAFVVKEYDANATFGEGKNVQSRPDILVDVYILDGPPVEFGGTYPINGDPHTPPTHVIHAPAMLADRKFGGVNMVEALKGSVGGGPVVGVVVQSTIGNKPWNITKLPVGDPRRTAGGQMWAQIKAGSVVVNREGVPIPGRAAPVAGANPYATGQPIPPAPVYAPPAPVYAPPVPGTYVGPTGYPSGPAAPGAMPVDPAYAAWQAAQAAAAAPPAPPVAPPVDPAYAAWQAAQAAAAAPPVDATLPCPPGYEAVWGGMDYNARMTVLRGPAGQAIGYQAPPLPAGA